MELCEAEIVHGLQHFDLGGVQLGGLVLVGGDQDAAREELLQQEADRLELVGGTAHREADLPVGAVLRENHGGRVGGEW